VEGDRQLQAVYLNAAKICNQKGTADTRWTTIEDRGTGQKFRSHFAGKCW